MEKMVYARYVLVVVKSPISKTWTKFKNIMNKIEKEGKLILKTNENRMFDFD